MEMLLNENVGNGARDETADYIAPSRSLEDYGLRVQDGQVYSITGKGAREKLQLVANFIVVKIRCGTSRYLCGAGTPLHHVQVTSPTAGDLLIKIRGSFYTKAGYEGGSHGALVVPKPQAFATYLSHQITHGNVRHVLDPSVNEVFVMGTYVDEAQQLVASDGVDFPHGMDECPYHNRTFAMSGDKDVFHRVADLHNNDSIRTLLAWGLGSPLKGAMEWAYANAEVTADSGVGKSTISDVFTDRFGWLRVAGPTEFGTIYRGKRAVANSVLPIQVEEIGRLSGEAMSRITQVLNLSYNIAPTTHGAHGKTYVMVTPALLWGQDFCLRDVALSAKMIRLTLSTENKNPSALDRLRDNADVWPMRDWIEFLCDWANQCNVMQLVMAKSALLRQHINDAKFTETSNTERTVANYARLLVSAEALNAFGVTVDISQYVAGLLRQHLAEQTLDTASIARQFLGDLLLEIQKASGQSALIHDLRPTGLFFNVTNALKVLQGRGYRYDIKSPRKLTEMLKNEGLGTPSVQHRLGRTQSRFFFVPRQTLAEFDFWIDHEEVA